MYTTPEGLRRTRLNTEMDGMSVFSFGITKAPQSFNLLMERFSLDRESLDYFVMHQANYFMKRLLFVVLGLVCPGEPVILSWMKM